MASANPSYPESRSSGAASSAPAVRLEVSQGHGPATAWDVSPLGFLIGTVAGCDLRVPGTGLPPVLALITRHADGPWLRKLLPTFPLLLNGISAANGPLADGDRLAVGPVEILIRTEAVAQPDAGAPPEEARPGEREEARTEFEAEQARWYRRREEREAALERREQEVQRREQAADQDQEQVRLLREKLDERARETEGEQTRLRAEGERLARQRADLDAALAELTRRGSAFEGQQAVVTALRTRLEQLSEDLRHEARQLAEQRAEQGAAEADLRQRAQEVQRLRAELDAESQAREEERRRYTERGAVMEAALAQFREVQAHLEVEEDRLRDRTRLLDATGDQQAEEASVLAAKAAQLLALQQRLTAERQSLRERESALAQSEQVREALQEQLRRRSEDLAARQRELAEQARLHGEQIAALEQHRAEVVHEQRQAEEVLAQTRGELDARAAELERRQEELSAEAGALESRQTRLRNVGRRFGAARKAFRQAHNAWLAEQEAAAASDAQRKVELEAARQEALALRDQLPELELQAQAALERLGAAREQLREHLAELHAYARQGREDLEALRARVQAEAEAVRQRELELHRAREEHRLAVASFRQQLIEWQGQVGELKRTLAHDETRLERRAAKVEEQTRHIDAASVELTQRAEQVVEGERRVAERRTAVERHLDDMRAWYRKKLRELAGATPVAAPRDILPLHAEAEPGDEQLGSLLRRLKLVDRETLTTLLSEARRRRRSLRQLLLTGGHLTLYQMALIEAGDLDRLMLGPVRVIDRLRSTAHETTYRVFDPRRGEEAVLRHLAEAEAEDAVRPDEFRQRFAQAATIRHPNVESTLEVLEVVGRPAVLQERLNGVHAADWPPLTATPGVWYRLLRQAALGLHAAHEVGVVHGHLHPGRLLLAEDGMLKLCGFGEPPWLRTPPTPVREEDAADDLFALGRIAADWVAVPPPRVVKPLAEPLAAVLRRLTTNDAEAHYPSLAALLEELDRVEPDVPDAGAAWERFVRAAREEEKGEGLRQSA